MRYNYLLALLIIFSFISCKNEAPEPIDYNALLGIDKATQYREPYRPQFHFSPPSKWMNDPNGMVFHKGIYHLFYQYYPEDIVWGPMHWGHATSKDLIQWENKPIALYPDENGLIFSGSAVVDVNNTSRFGTKDNPPLVAIYTYHDMEGEKAGRTDFQTQGIAYSLDNGETWTKYNRNPVIRNDGSMKDFRDPKVFWHQDSKQWIMTLVAGDHAKFYTSRNLKNWYLRGEFGKDKGAHGGVWECPDLFKLKIEGTEEEKWILLISINPGAPNGGSGTQYFIGDFDGKTFTSEHDDVRWIDYGTDNYAGVTYSDLPNDDRIFIGWMSNWNYARNTPTERWRSAMTLPRKLTLNRDKDSSLILKNYPIKQFDDIRKDYKRIHKLLSQEPFLLEHHELSTSEISFSANLKDDYTVRLQNNKNEEYVFHINPAASQMATDRRKSGLIDFHESFAKAIHKQNYKVSDTLAEVRMILDRSSVEIFVDGGRYVFTDQVFPTEPFSKVEIASKSAPFHKDIKVFLINTIWTKDE